MKPQVEANENRDCIRSTVDHCTKGEREDTIKGSVKITGALEFVGLNGREYVPI